MQTAVDTAPALPPAASPSPDAAVALASTMAPPAAAAFVQAISAARAHRLDLVGLMTAAEAARVAGSPKASALLYQTWLQALPAGSPHLALAHVALFNLGVSLGALNDHAGAEAAYRRALALRDDFVEAHINLGTQIEAQGRRPEAIAVWQQVFDRGLTEDPSRRALRLHLLNNLGRALEIDKAFARAERMLALSLAIDPEQPDVLQHYVHLRQKQCEWPWYQPPPGVAYGSMARATSMLAMLAAFDDPAFQLHRAATFLRDKVDLPAGRIGYPAARTPSVIAPADAPDHRAGVVGRAAAASTPAPAPSAGAAPAAPRKLRIGYLSSDFCQHAVSMLTIELFELHDRERFEIFAFSWSRDDASPMRQRLLAAFTEYVPIHALSDEQAAEQIRARGIDVLVDLQGLTSGARPAILACRPAPVQITYLGLPGTTGMPFVDYVIADPFVLPEWMTPFFTEKPLYMPNCFQSSDRRRVACEPPTREEAGLPARGTVFCCFNNNYKFSDSLFACWMRILGQVPDSVLWLLADNEWARASMLAAARAHGIDEARLVFAPRTHLAMYFARYKVADLFLDTMPFNGGTTANDALYMGLPLLTCPGRTFASRMAGSLLHHLGLPELIADDLADYERRAVEIGLSSARQRELKDQLARARDASPVFDMNRFVRDLEARFARLSEANPR